MDAKRSRAAGDAFSERLRSLHGNLRVVHSGVVVAAAALQCQNVDRDQDVARVLTHCVGDRLFEQIERTAELIASLRHAAGDDPAEGGA